ncbi:hypothetical protein [Sessilibacter corallicola]|uniref:hypothetical protein n=1 Tax=Sessilibacter corallicola TaxID=2904075 RepID=UPI001E32037A|nr:hypothetical protein [Sessilibacter corallicola]MCE2028697.1 hypothetical protein [Sessilibacter corallicola]
MTKYLYLKTDEFSSNEDMANYFVAKLSEKGLKLEKPIDAGFMCSVVSRIDDERVVFYMGRNQEPSSPALWQIWPEQKIPFFKVVFGKANRTPEDKARMILEEVVHAIESASDIGWAK